MHRLLIIKHFIGKPHSSKPKVERFPWRFISFFKQIKIPPIINNKWDDNVFKEVISLFQFENELGQNQFLPKNYVASLQQQETLHHKYLLQSNHSPVSNQQAVNPTNKSRVFIPFDVCLFIVNELICRILTRKKEPPNGQLNLFFHKEFTTDLLYHSWCHAVYFT